MQTFSNCFFKILHFIYDKNAPEYNYCTIAYHVSKLTSAMFMVTKKKNC